MNLYEAIKAMTEITEKVNKELDETLYSLRGPVPENPSPQGSGLGSGGVFGPLERLAGSLMSIEPKINEIKARIGSDKNTSITPETYKSAIYR